MAKHKQVFNKAESKKAAALKGSVRSTVLFDAIHTCKSQKHVDRKKLAKAGGRNKHQTRNYGY